MNASPEGLLERARTWLLRRQKRRLAAFHAVAARRLYGAGRSEEARSRFALALAIDPAVLDSGRRQDRKFKRDEIGRRHAERAEVRRLVARIFRRKLKFAAAPDRLEAALAPAGFGDSAFVLRWTATDRSGRSRSLYEKGFAEPAGARPPREIAFYRSVSLTDLASAKIVLPRCYAYGELDHVHSVFLENLARRHGRSRSRRVFSWDSCPSIAAALGEFNANCRVAQGQEGVFSGLPLACRLTPSALRRVQRVGWLNLTRPQLRRIVRLLEELYRQREAILGKAALHGMVLSHCDINRGNLWLGRRSGKLILLDFENCALTPPGVDLGSYLAHCGRRLIEQPSSADELAARLSGAISAYERTLSQAGLAVQGVAATVRYIMLMQGMKRGDWWTSGLAADELGRRFDAVYAPLVESIGSDR